MNIKEEQKKLREEIKRIKKSNIFEVIEKSLIGFSQQLKSDPKNSIIDLKGRMKKPGSACKKMKKQGIPADGIYDLIAFMYVVDLPEDYERAKSILQECVPPNTYTQDYNGRLPKNNGYSSYHMGLTAKKLIEMGLTSKELIDVSQSDFGSTAIELQLKSYGMYIAQESTHDTIYKNPSLSGEKKDGLQTVMFPLIERIVNIQKYQEHLDNANLELSEEKREKYNQRISSEEQEILKLKMGNKEFINQNIQQVESILKEFIIVQYVEKMKNDPDYKDKYAEQLKGNVKKAIETLYNQNGGLLMTNSKPTGFGKIDEVYGTIMDYSIEQIQELDLQEQPREKPPLLKGAIKEGAKPGGTNSKDMKTMAIGLVRGKDDNTKLEEKGTKNTGTNDDMDTK